MRTWILLVSVFGLLVASESADCAIAALPTNLATHCVEALAIDSPIIVIGELTVAPANHGRPAQIRIRPIELLKRPSELDSLPAEISADDCFFPTPAKVRTGERALVFLSGTQQQDDRWSFDLQDLVPLDRTGSAFSIRAPVIRDLSLRPVPNSEDVVARVRAEVARAPQTRSLAYLSNCQPFDLVCFPNDARLVSASRQWAQSTEPLPRMLAIAAFHAHPDPSDVPALQSFLRDPFQHAFPRSLSPWSTNDYVVRRAAARELIDRKIPVPPTIFSTPRTGLYSRVPLSALAIALVGPFAGFALARRRFRVQLERREMTVFRSARAYVSFACFLIAALASVLWIRSDRTADDVVLAQAGSLLQVTSIEGNVYGEWIPHWPATCPLEHLSVTPDANNLEDPADATTLRGVTGSFHDTIGSRYRWNFYRLLPFPVTERFADVKLPDPLATARTRVAGRALGISYPCIIVLCLIFPAVHATLPVFRRRRRRKRAAESLCVRCGYDLRATPKSSPCPECGTRSTLSTP